MKSQLLILEALKPLTPVIDALFSLLVVAPLVVIYWVTSWKLCDIVITPYDPTLSAVISFVIGFCGQLGFMFFQVSIAALLTFKTNKYKHVINLMVSKMYALLFAQTCINLWRSMWTLADFISPIDTFTTVLNVGRNLMIVMLTKTIKNSISPPFIVTTDQVNESYAVVTYFGKSVSSTISIMMLNLL
jgi:Fuseless